MCDVWLLIQCHHPLQLAPPITILRGPFPNVSHPGRCFGLNSPSFQPHVLNSLLTPFCPFILGTPQNALLYGDWMASATSTPNQNSCLCSKWYTIWVPVDCLWASVPSSTHTVKCVDNHSTGDGGECMHTHLSQWCPWFMFWWWGILPEKVHEYTYKADLVAII